jgi:hypothetical protein
MQNKTSKQNPSIMSKTNRGNTLEIQFVYPEKNSEEVLKEITIGLSYCGLFHGISKGKENTTKN